MPRENAADQAFTRGCDATLGRESAPHAAGSLVVLGVDPGLRNLGWALIVWSATAIRFLAMGTIVTKPPKSVQDRCAQLWDGLDAAISTFGCERPDVVVIEEQARAWQGKQKAGKTNADATKARVAEGIARGWAIARRAELLELTPQQLRKGVGVGGNASKDDVARVACLRSRAPSSGQRNHATDALGLAIAGGARVSVLRRLSEAKGRRQ